MTVVNACTAQLKSGRFCDAPSMDEAPFPICQRHSLDVYRVIRDLMEPRNMLATRQKYAMTSIDREKAAPDRESLVYYLAFGDDQVKIGYTTNLRKRLATLSLLRDHVLAVEPGNDSLESRRHREFAADRVSAKRELFKRSDVLDEHIARLAANHAVLRERVLRRSA